MTLNEVLDMLYGIFFTTGIAQLSWQHVLMWGIGCLFLYLAIVKEFEPLLIFGLGLVDFAVCTAGGICTVKVMNLFLKEKINPLIGSAGVSAVPMSARVSQIMGQKYDKGNYLLMHAMGPNLAGVIGTAAAAGMFIAMFS